MTEKFPLDICYVRLDFVNLVTTGPTTNTGQCGTDTVTVTSPISSTANAASPPVVCGNMNGQHSKCKMFILIQNFASDIY